VQEWARPPLVAVTSPLGGGFQILGKAFSIPRMATATIEVGQAGLEDMGSEAR
jgi:hypothetical protein